MPTQPQKRKINPLAIIAIILILLALGMLFLIFAPGPRMKWALTMGEKYLTDCEYTQAVTMFSRAIRVDDRSEPAYWGRAQAYVQLGDSAAATSDLTYIIDEIGTENADVYLTRRRASRPDRRRQPRRGHDRTGLTAGSPDPHYRLAADANRELRPADRWHGHPAIQRRRRADRLHRNLRLQRLHPHLHL